MGQQRVYLVTGGSRGIGRAIATALAADGAVVGLGYLHSVEAAHALAASYPELIFPVRFDVANASKTQNAINKFARDYKSLSGVVCCAGVGKPLLLARHTPELVAEYVGVNLLGTIYTVQAALPHLRKTTNPVVVTISSIAAARPSVGQSVYAATKGGVEGFTRGLAAEYGPRGLRAVSIRLGLVTTGMMRLLPEKVVAAVCREMSTGRPYSPEEVAAFVLAVIQTPSDQSVVLFDGGYLKGGADA
jgi:NAD(P)-dependent dehydrogenase (short-subunit alcohol dehydrogenase family)